MPDTIFDQERKSYRNRDKLTIEHVRSLEKQIQNLLKDKAILQDQLNILKKDRSVDNVNKIICPRCMGNGYRMIWKDAEQKEKIAIDCTYCKNQGEVEITPETVNNQDIVTDTE